MDAPPAYSEVTRPLSMPWRVAWLLIPQAAPTEWLPRPSRSRLTFDDAIGVAFSKPPKLL